MPKTYDSFWMISYDITDDKRRIAVAKRLENSAVRVQFSVFEAYLTEHEYKSLVADLSGIIDANTDSVRFYPLCADCLEHRQSFGLKTLLDTGEYLFFL